MERRSWLWRRKSSEKSPGETESSGSVSSGRFSDEQVLILSVLWRLISRHMRSILCLIVSFTINFILEMDVFFKHLCFCKTNWFNFNRDGSGWLTLD